MSRRGRRRRSLPSPALSLLGRRLVRSAAERAAGQHARLLCAGVLDSRRAHRAIRRGEDTMNRPVTVLAVLAAAWLVGVAPAAARTDAPGPPPGLHGRAPARDALGPGAVRQRRRRARARRRPGVGCARRGHRDARRRRRHLALRGRRPRATCARRRPDRPAARPERGRGERAGAWPLRERQDDADARELPDHGTDVRGPEAAELLLLDAVAPGRLRAHRPVPRRQLLATHAHRLLLPRLQQHVEAVRR